MVERTERAERPDTEGLLRVETTNSVWVFDTQNMRFWRVPRGLDVNSPTVARAWQRYYALDMDLDSGAITVALNPERTRLLRGWRRYPDDGQHPTTEVPAAPKVS
jgi:hypothetical protein